MPFVEAVTELRRRELWPTNLRSADIADVIHRNAFTSARTTISEVLDTYQKRIDAIISPRPEQRVDRETGATYTVHVSPSLADVRQEIKAILAGKGYEAPEGKEGGIEDLASDARIKLVVDTNADIARGFGWAAQGNDPDVLDAFPGQELVRVEDRKVPREWHERWKAALDAAGDDRAAGVYEASGRMVALKDSGVWQALGDGAGGYDDTLGNPFPPFAFNSGMDVEDVDFSTAVELGLMQPGDKVEPIELDYPDTAKIKEESGE